MSPKFLTTLFFVVVGCVVGFLVYAKITHDHNHDGRMAHSTPLFVKEAIGAYEAQGMAAFDEFEDPENPQWVMHNGETYLFVINSMSGRIAAHGAGLSDPTPVQQALLNYIIARAKYEPTGTWVAYNFMNPNTGEMEIKRSWVVLHDDYVFGSGEYLKRGRGKHGHFRD